PRRDRIGGSLLRCIKAGLALSGHSDTAARCPLLEGKRTWLRDDAMFGLTVALIARADQVTGKRSYFLPCGCPVLAQNGRGRCPRGNLRFRRGADMHGRVVSLV